MYNRSNARRQKVKVVKSKNDGTKTTDKKVVTKKSKRGVVDGNKTKKLKKKTNAKDGAGKRSRADEESKYDKVVESPAKKPKSAKLESFLSSQYTTKMEENSAYKLLKVMNELAPTLKDAVRLPEYTGEEQDRKKAAIEKVVMSINMTRIILEYDGYLSLSEVDMLVSLLHTIRVSKNVEFFYEEYLDLEKKASIPSGVKWREMDAFSRFSSREPLSVFQVKSFKESILKKNIPVNQRELLYAMNDLGSIPVHGFIDDSVLSNGNFEMSNILKLQIRKELLDGVNNFSVETVDTVSDIPIYFAIVTGGGEILNVFNTAVDVVQEGLGKLLTTDYKTILEEAKKKMKDYYADVTHAKHAVICILYKNQFYTFGFVPAKGDPKDTKNVEFWKKLFQEPVLQKLQQVSGMNFTYMSNGGIVTPDTLFQPANTRNYKNRIVDIGILDKSHIENINKYIERDRMVNTDFTWSEVYNTKTESFEPGVKVRRHLIDTDMDYSAGSSFSFTAMRNCATFVTTIFPHINCEALYSLSYPGSCVSDNPMTDEKISKVFELYYENDTKGLIELLERKKSWWSF